MSILLLGKPGRPRSGYRYRGPVSSFLTDLFGLDGRAALVTGGSSGIGREIAGALARAGAQVILVARNGSALAEAANEINATWYAADLGDRDALDRMAGSVPTPDILVNAAAVNIRPPLPDLTRDEWDRTIAVNLTAPYLLGQRFGPRMAERGWGRIVNLVSQQAIRAYGNSGGYGAAKAGLAGLTRSQAEAWSRSGVCVNAIAPGIVRTPMTAPIQADEDRWRALAARTLAGRNGEVSDFAGVALFLASRASDYVTGQTIFVDGGFSVA
jgi:NAD(P)-dependent dehydrogenase (short-subunit alcohol dehydrogenase family)